ncbi:MAG: Ig-like domain-containing protein [Kineosporiaceae bacterium]
MTAAPPLRRRRGGAAGQTDARAAARCGRSDAGFTLVEVVVALVLLSILLASVGVLFVGGLRNSATLQRRQSAVNIAQQALEAARAVSTTPDQNGCTKLLQGRAKATVDVQWAAAPSAVTNVTDEAWSPAGCSGTIVLPLQGLPGALGTVTDPVIVGGQSYTVSTYIGTCVLTAARDSCLRSSAVPGGTSTMYRIVARATWSGSGCSTALCEYSASTLVDASADPVFNVRGAAGPAAVGDTVCLASGGPGTINIIANDTGSLGSSPVTIVTAPHKGTLGWSITSGIGAYTPQSGATGTDTFTYYDTDVNGLISGTVTVTITIGGC